MRKAKILKRKILLLGPSFLVVVFIGLFFLQPLLAPISFAVDETPPADGQIATDPTPTPTPDPAELSCPSDPTPTPDPTLTPTPTPDPCLSACPSEEVDNTNQATDSGNTEVAVDTGNEVAGKVTDGSEVGSGDINASVEAVNQVNTNLTDSTLDVSVDNILGSQSGDIDLSKKDNGGQNNPSAESAGLAKDTKVVNENKADDSGNVSVTTNTGNTVSGDLAKSIVGSGDTNLAVSVVNTLNANLTSSSLVVRIINIFGDLLGNIILPDDFSSGQDGAAQSVFVLSDNTASDSGNVGIYANTGNTIGGSVEGSNVESGDANVFVNSITFINTNSFGIKFSKLIINTFGSWTGKFLGWGNAGAQDPVTQIVADNYSQSSACNGGFCSNSSVVYNKNSASSSANVAISANTGNTISGDAKCSNVSSGDINLAASVFTLANSNMTYTNGFFAIINIFGNFVGDIGGESKFEKSNGEDTSQNSLAATQSTDSSDGNNRQDGGKLSITNKAFVGSFVYPGDTVTFEIVAQNIGTGPVYDARVESVLLNEAGQIVGIAKWDLGTIEQAQGKKISYGLALSPKTPAGTYYNVATVYGSVNHTPEDASVSAQSEFNVKARGTLSVLPEASAQDKGEVLGATTATPPPASQSQRNWWALLLLVLAIVPSFIKWLRNQQIPALPRPFVRPIFRRSRSGAGSFSLKTSLKKPL